METRPRNHHSMRRVWRLLPPTGLLLLLIHTAAIIFDAGHPPAATAQAEPSCDTGGQIAMLRVTDLVVQADPASWRALFPTELPGGCLSFWDAEERRSHATAHVTVPAAQLDAAGALRQELATDSRSGIALTVVARPAAPGVLSLRITPSHLEDVRALDVCLPAVPGEHFFGLGERFDGFDLAGQIVDNWAEERRPGTQQRGSYSPTPFLLSSRGYGLLLDTTARATFDLRSNEGCYDIRVETPELHMYLIAGPHPRTVVERHAQLVGLPPLPPRWAFGIWKNLTGGAARVERDLRQLRQAGVPLDAVWIYDAVDDRSGFGWPWQVYGPIGPGTYPDLPGLIRRLHGMDLRVLGYLNPFFYPGSPSFDQAARQGFLVRDAQGQPYVEAWTYSPRAWLDFTNPEASAWWQARVVAALTRLGFDGAMLDFGDSAPVDAHYASGQPGHMLHNAYPVLYHQAAFMAAQAAKPGAAVFFARAGYGGSQRYTTGRFTGDQVRSWDRAQGLPSVVPALLSGSLSGWPYWGPDIGGYLEGDWAGAAAMEARERQQAAERELWIRWVQLGALAPTMRDMRGMQRDPIGILTDAETLAIFRGYARLHTALRDYLYHYAEIAHTRGLPIVRPLFLDEPNAATYAIADQYLLGDDLLVAPILQPGQRQRRLYLPTGRWRDAWSGQIYIGPGWATVAAPLEQIPLFVRDGATVDLPAPSELGLPASDR